MSELLATLGVALDGRYAIEREIGRGGMATVFLARDIKHSRAVAIKVLLPELTSVLGAERFLNEIRVTAGLQHPHLLSLFDSGEAGGLLFYVMPFVEGETVRARLEREGQLPIEDAVRIATGVASALSYAHRHGVIHRDLKPENLLLQDGHALVADFGIALAVAHAGGERLTQSGLSLGTPAYMSPEQAAADRSIDARTDIYSLAAILYEMLVGEPPHTGQNAQTIISRVINEQARPVSAVRPRVPVHVEAAIVRALEKRPADRFATAAEFADALTGKQVVLRPHNRSLLARVRDRARDPVTASLALVSVALAVVAIIERRGPDLPPPAVRIPFTLPQASQIPHSLAISADGLIVARVGVDSGGVAIAYARRLGDSEAKRVPNTEGARSIFFSPDGNALGVYTLDGRLQSVSLTTGAVTRIATLVVLGAPTWAANGEVIFAAPSGLFSVPSVGGSPKRLTHPDPSKNDYRHESPVALGDGEHVLFTSRDASNSSNAIGVLSLRSGKSSLISRLQCTRPLGAIDGFVICLQHSGPDLALVAYPFNLKREQVLGDPVPLLTDVGGTEQAVLSASGTLAYDKGSARTDLVLANMNGEVTPFRTPEGSYAHPRFSPDGLRLAVEVQSAAGTAVWTYDRKTGVPTQIVGDRFAERPEWTHDSKAVLFRTKLGTRGDGQPMSGIWQRRVDLSAEAVPVIGRDSGWVYEAVVTRDGSRIVVQYEGPDSKGEDVRIRAFTGDTTWIGIATSGANQWMGRPSPDGRWIAYTSNASNTRRVFVTSSAGGGAHFPISPGHGQEPVWSPDGKRLFYRDGTSIRTVRYQSSPDFSMIDDKPLFNDTFALSLMHANYDISPDGSRFIFVRRVGPSSVEIVHNWVTEVLERVRTVR